MAVTESVGEMSCEGEGEKVFMMLHGMRELVETLQLIGKGGS